MRHISTFLVAGGLLMGSASMMTAQQLAFPGAQGWGRFAKGGRTGSVYHVTNLNDNGAGSLRDAVSQPNRIVVFDVAGVINIDSRIVFASNLYVAGQTAPGEGITVYGNGVSFSGSSNIICRHMRFRMGKGGDSGKDCAGIANGTNMIFDHCSFAWGLDETFSINSDGRGALHSITLMNCVFGQGLLTHSAGGLMQADSITLYRNFYCDNGTRNNKVKGYHQYVNNVVYNWKNGCYIMGGDSDGESHANTQGNLFINGPAGGGNACTTGNERFHIYADDNWQDRNKDGELNPYLIPNEEYTGGVDFQSKPFDFPVLEVVPAQTLIDEVLPTVGASLPYRDYVDYYMVDECKSFGKKGVLISDEKTLPYGVPSSWNVWKGNVRVDSDNDGMPDAWEIANGTDPNKDDAMTIAANGYTYIENYINSITAESVDFYLRAPMLLELAEATPSSLTLSWADYTQGEEGFVVEIEKDGTFVEAGKTAANVKTFTIQEGLEAGTAYTVRVYAYKGEERSEYVTAVVKTQPEQVEMVDVDNYVPDYTWGGGDGVWDFTSPVWNGALYQDGGKVLFQVDAPAHVILNETVAPASVVVKGDADLSIGGESGSIGGAGSVNKVGSGVLKLEGDNTYTGATVLRGGTIEFSTLKNGGENSAIGASQEFAQNWVWYGGTYRYTGASTSTNRSAVLYKDTELEITDETAKVTMTGKMEGNGGFILNGKGTLSLNDKDFFSYEGATILRGGKLYLNGISTMWSDKLVKLGSSPKLVMAGGFLETKDANDTYATYQFPIEVVSDTYSTIKVHRNCSIASEVSGDGTLEYQANYLREYVTGNWDNFTGTLVVNGVNGKAGECQFMLYNGKGIENASIYLKGNVQVVSWKASATYSLGGLSGEAGTYLSGFSKNTTSSKGTWIVGGANTDETFHGVIDNRCSASGKNGTVSIRKIGSGLWRLTGRNIYSGTTEVAEGKLVVNGQNTGSGAVTVMDEAVLAGIGFVSAAVTVKAGGMVYAGDTTIINKNTLTLNKLTVEEGGAVCIPIQHDATLNKANRLVLKGTVDLTNAVLKLDMKEVTKGISDNSYFTVFDVSAKPVVTGEFVSVEPAVPGEDQEWDLSSLFTTGRLYVRPKGWNGIEEVAGDKAEPVRTVLYDLCGNIVESENAKGIYVCKTWTADGKVAVKRVLIP